jgi:hypothetical protein
MLLGLALVLGAATAAADEVKEVPTVHVDGVRDPMLRSYRAVSAGLDEFEEYRQRLAPGAPELRFRARRGGSHPAAPEGLVLRIASDDASVPVPIGAGGLFAVPRLEAAYASDADLVFNQKRSTFRIDPEIRTSGLPQNVRRLGDLRLECKVTVAIGKKEMKFWQVAMVDTLLVTTDWCAKFGQTDSAHMKDIGFPFRSLALLAGATLRDGDRAVTLKVDKTTFQVPIGDTSWSNDALIELQYAGETVAVAQPAI